MEDICGCPKDVGGRSFRFSGLSDGASTDRDSSGATCGCLIGVGFGEVGGQVNALGFLSCSSSFFCLVERRIGGGRCP